MKNKFDTGDKISFNWNGKPYKGTITWDEQELTYLVFGKDVATYLHILLNSPGTHVKKIK